MNRVISVAKLPHIATPLWSTLAFLALAFAQPRTMTSIVPALAYGPHCSTTLQLQNLSDRPVAFSLDGHRESGALVSLAGQPTTALRLDPHQQAVYSLAIDEETTSAWAKVTETIPEPSLSPALAITAATECTIDAQLRTTTRTVAYPTRNPWFAGDVADMPANVISLINTSESAIRATACYSSGSLYSVQGAPLQPVCDSTLDVQVPPFNSRQFPVSRNGTFHFSLKTQGRAIVLEMLRPLSENLHIYAVDSSIKFGDEAK